jgi:transposase
MKRFVEGTDRAQSTLFPECLEDWIDENNPVQVVDAFVEELDLEELEFDGLLLRQPAVPRIILRSC